MLDSDVQKQMWEWIEMISKTNVECKIKEKEIGRNFWAILTVTLATEKKKN